MFFPLSFKSHVIQVDLSVLASYVKFNQMSALRFRPKSSDETDMMISVHTVDSSRSAAAVVNVRGSSAERRTDHCFWLNKYTKSNTGRYKVNETFCDTNYHWTGFSSSPAILFTFSSTALRDSLFVSVTKLVFLHVTCWRLIWALPGGST